MNIMIIGSKLSNPYLGPSVVLKNTLNGFLGINEKLDKYDIHLTFLSFDDKMEKTYTPNIDVISVNKLPFFDVAGEIQTLFRRVNIEVDVVHTHILQFIPAYLRKKILFTIHGVGWNEKKFKKNLGNKFTEILWEMRLKSYYKFISKLVAISPYVVDELKKRGFDTSKTEIIGNPVSDDFFNVKKNWDNIILYPATIKSLKNQFGFLRAISKIKKEIKDYKIVFAGSGDPNYIAQIREYSRKEGINVDFLGKVPYTSMPHLYSKASLVTLVSFQETFSMALLEAMATGTPVLASGVGGVPWLLKNCGYVVDPNDTNEISKKILEIIEDDSLKKAMGKKCRNRAEDFRSEKIARRLLDLYMNI